MANNKPQYIKGANGKMKGSIGAGKDNVPTSNVAQRPLEVSTTETESFKVPVPLYDPNPPRWAPSSEELAGLDPEQIHGLWRAALDVVSDGSRPLRGIKYGTAEWNAIWKAMEENREESRRIYDQWNKDNPPPPYHSPEREARVRDHGAHEDERFNEIVGSTVKGIHWSEEAITFDTDKGFITYEIDPGFSDAFFFDFYGVKNLLENGPITAFDVVELQEGDLGYLSPEQKEPENFHVIEVYGYRFTTVHPVFGEVTSVFSFRSISNGYYGGEMQRLSDRGQGNESQRLWENRVFENQFALTSDLIGNDDRCAPGYEPPAKE